MHVNGWVAETDATDFYRRPPSKQRGIARGGAIRTQNCTALSTVGATIITSTSSTCGGHKVCVDCDAARIGRVRDWIVMEQGRDGG